MNRYRVILRPSRLRTNPPQRTPYTCGPAVAVDVLFDHGIPVTEQAVAAAARTLKRTGTTAGGLARALRAYGVPARVLRPKTVRPGDLVRLHDGREDHWVRALLTGATVTYYDPWAGRRRTASAEGFRAMRQGAERQRWAVVRPARVNPEGRSPFEDLPSIRRERERQAKRTAWVGRGPKALAHVLRWLGRDIPDCWLLVQIDYHGNPLGTWLKRRPKHRRRHQSGTGTMEKTGFGTPYWLYEPVTRQLAEHG